MWLTSLKSFEDDKGILEKLSWESSRKKEIEVNKKIEKVSMFDIRESITKSNIKEIEVYTSSLVILCFILCFVWSE